MAALEPQILACAAGAVDTLGPGTLGLELGLRLRALRVPAEQSAALLELGQKLAIVDLLEHSAAWRAFDAYVNSPAFLRGVIDTFGPQLLQNNPELRHASTLQSKRRDFRWVRQANNHTEACNLPDVPLKKPSKIHREERELLLNAYRKRVQADDDDGDDPQADARS